MSTTDRELWNAFTSGTPTERHAARDHLLAEHLGLVHHVARQLARFMASRANLDEMVSAGTMGLMSALEGFDPARGLAFSTFAAPRIRGAILDELRRQDYVPRSVRRKARELTQARETLQHRFGRPPAEAEVAYQLGIDMDTLWKWEADVEHTVHVPLDYRPGEGENAGATSPVELLPDQTYDDIEATITHEQEVTLLRDAIMKLKEQERVVLSLYYFEELKLHEIASVLKLTESRVSQIRSKALERLRGELAQLRDLVA